MNFCHKKNLYIDATTALVVSDNVLLIKEKKGKNKNNVSQKKKGERMFFSS
jgi:hypothetical protein